METVHQWAERLVAGTTLADKLADAPDRDRALRGAVVPRWPGRPASLRIPARRRVDPPRPDEVDRPEVAIHALHTFVNHELQALELMAAALLRFPDAPAAFRRGLVATIGDEQRHLRRYHERLVALGGVLGEAPASAMFWETLRNVDDPAAFVAGMSLGFEQANLDFARMWREAFARAGDRATAAVLDEVYADEIRHVSLGRVWFERWRAPALSLFEAWRRALVPPLTPERARGPSLDRAGRRAAGLPDAYVRELAVTRASRGRRPTVWWFTPWVEDELAGRTPPTDPTPLSWVMAVAARPGDAIVSPRPSVRFLEAWAAAGLPVPEVVSGPVDQPGRPVGQVQAWGEAPSVVAALGPDAAEAEERVARARTLSRRGWAVARAAELGLDDVGWVCTAVAEVEAAVGAVDGPWVAKAELSASGRHRIRGDGPLTEANRRWVARTLGRGAIVVERWLDGIVDLSVQLEVDGAEARTIGLTRFHTRRGVFRGVRVGDWHRGLPSEVLRFAHGDGRRPGWLEGRLREVGLAVAGAAAEEGHRGALGIDALVHRAADGLALRPLVEVNPRWTVGRLAVELRGRLAPGSAGWWAFLSRRSLGAQAAERVWRMVEAHPPELEDGRLAAGCVPTHDPDGGGPLLTVLVVGRDRADLDGRLARVGLDPSRS